MKKIVYILILFVSFSVFSQKTENNSRNDLKITNVNAYPNPFTIKTNISFNSSSDTNITFTVQNLLGNTITSKEIFLSKGKNSIPFYRNKLNAGIYIYTLKAKNKVISKRFVVK